MRLYFSLFLIILFLGCHKPPPAQSVFYNAWTNEDEFTRGITRFEIWPGKRHIKVHMWGRCHPEDCDWGETTGELLPDKDNILSVIWDTKVRTRQHTMTILADGRLRLDATARLKGYPDSKPRSNTYFFIKE